MAILLGAFGLLLIVSSAAFAATPINETFTDQLYVLLPDDSPYTLGHDFHVQPGGFFLVSSGAELQIDNGSKLYGDGGTIQLDGTLGAESRVGPQPGGSASTWGGIELRNGSTLTLRHTVLSEGDPLITSLGVATIDARNVRALGCGAWCLNITLNTVLILHDSSFENGSWGIIDRGGTNPFADNVSLRNFTSGGVFFTGSSSGANFRSITITDSSIGVRTDGLRSASLGPLWISATSGPALRGSGTVDVLVHDATLSGVGFALDESTSVRLRVASSALNGTAGALRLLGATAPSLTTNTMASPNGTCLFLANATNALLRNNALDPCRYSIDFDPTYPPSSADVDTSNTVGGREVRWITNQANVVLAGGSPGFVALFSVAGANLSDFDLAGAGIFVYGSQDVRVERVRVTRAAAGLTGTGVQRLVVNQFVASDVAYGVRILKDPFYTVSQDIVINHTRFDHLSAAGIVLREASNVRVLWTFVGNASGGLDLTAVNGALLDHLVLSGAATGIAVADSPGITVVDSVLENSSIIGLRASNSTGYAARNAFLFNSQQASVLGSPGFLLNETGGGNYWTGWAAPDSNRDGWADIPYNLTDGSGVDHRPRTVRYDFAPAVIVHIPAAAEVGVAVELNASLSFDDFAVAAFYWEVDIPGPNETASGPTFPWSPNFTGVLVVHVTAVDIGGAVDDYWMNVTVVDTLGPRFDLAVVGVAKGGGNTTIAVENATDNSPTFPANATLSWSLRGPSLLTRTGASVNLTFVVPTDLLGNYTLFVTVRDGAGNPRSKSLAFEVFDTDPPLPEFTLVGEPDLGVAFLVDASQTTDTAGVDTSSARWSWVDAGAPRNATSWPTLAITLVDSGSHTITLHLCDTVGNCGNTTLDLDARDRSAPRFQVLRVIVAGRAPLEFGPGAGNATTIGAQQGRDTVFEILAQDASGNITYQWDFGDGTTGNGSRIAHTYLQPGDYTVKVVMTDPTGNANVTAVRMHVEGGGLFGFLAPGFEAALALAATIFAAGLFRRHGSATRPRG